MQICTYSRKDLKDQRLPVGSTANTSFRLMKWSKASSWTGFNSRILETTIQRKLYCTSKARSNSLPSFAFFFFLKFLRTQKPVFRGSWGAFQRFGRWEFLLDHYHSERSGTKFEHQSATEFKICTHGSEVHNCRDQRFFFPLVTIADSPLNFPPKQQEKKPLVPRVAKCAPDLQKIKMFSKKATELWLAKSRVCR